MAHNNHKSTQSVHENCNEFGISRILMTHWTFDYGGNILILYSVPRFDCRYKVSLETFYFCGCFLSKHTKSRGTLTTHLEDIFGCEI